MKMFKRVSIMLLATAMLFVSMVFATPLNDQVQDVQQQYELLQQFIGNTMNSKARTNFDDAFMGILGTPMQPFYMEDGEFDDWFIVGIANEEDMFNEDLKEVISSNTGIPTDRIGFFWLDLNSAIWPEPQRVRVTFEQLDK